MIDAPEIVETQAVPTAILHVTIPRDRGSLIICGWNMRMEPADGTGYLRFRHLCAGIKARDGHFAIS